MQGNRESKAKTCPKFRVYTKFWETGKVRQRLSLRSSSALNVAKEGKQGEGFPYVSDLH